MHFYQDKNHNIKKKCNIRNIFFKIVSREIKLRPSVSAELMEQRKKKKLLF